MLYLATSNRIEALQDALLARLEASPPRSPLEPCTLVVDSLAQRRALTMAIAQRQGVAINLRFVFLAQWLWQQMAAHVPGVAPDTPFDAATLSWRIDRLLTDPGFVQRQPRLSPYLDACDETMRYAFARRTAGLLEHYTTYRHDWLERWSRGDALAAPPSIEPGTTAHRAWTDDEAWQRALWQALERDLGLPGEHPAQRFVRSLEASEGEAKEHHASAPLPRRIHVFALPAIAPLHLHLLAALGRVIDVHVYALNPSRAYWVDVVSDKRLAQLRARGSVHALHTHVGHPLLSAWGAQVQAQHALLQQHVGVEVVDTDAFVEVPGTSRLARMQRAILELDEPTAPPDDDNDDAVGDNDDPVGDDDDSVEIHVAHSLRRELEAIQQRLLALFAQPDAPAPHEVLLATPDIDDAAPMIDAVFGAASGDAHVAYAITGRSGGDDGGAAAALLQLIDAGRSRWTADDLDGLLHLPLVAQRLRLSDDDLATLRDWIGTAGMRFGIDAAHRQALDLPPNDAWTLDDAIERLLMGHALAPDGRAFDEGAAVLRQPLVGKLPAATVGGERAALLGSLAALQHALSQWRQRLAHAHAPAEWQRHLLWAIDEFLAPAQPTEQAGLRALRLALSQWHARLVRAGETRALSATLMRESLEHELELRAAGAVPGGSLNFASMTGLRRLPFRVVIVFGLNDGAWGASSAPAEWDLMARAPRLGDRQRRQDQRDVLLDLMLATRERFWISCTGRDQRDNHELPPAAVVDEWIEALAAADNINVDALRARIVVEHPLQPFAPELFGSDAPVNCRSHHRGYARALAQAFERSRAATRDSGVDHGKANVEPSEGDLFGPDSTFEIPTDAIAAAVEEADDEDAALDGNDDAAALIVRPLSPVPEAQRRVTLADLQRFFANPSRTFLEQRLGIALPWAEDTLRADEPFALDPRDRARLAHALMPAIRAGADDQALAAHARASGLLPAAVMGDVGIAHELFALRQQAQWLAGGETVRAKAVDLTVSTPDGEWQLVVATEYLPHDGLSIWRASKMTARARLEAWIEHLALDFMVDDREAARTVLVTRDTKLTLNPLPSNTDPAEPLRELVRLMAQGLREPLPFMPDLSWQAAQGKSRPPLDDDAAMPFGNDERRDPWVLLAWRGRSLSTHARFEATATAVYRTLSQRLANQIDFEDKL